MRHDSCAFFDRDDLIDGNIRQPIDLSAGPGDFERVDFSALSQAELDSRVAGRHITHAALGLFDVHEAFRGQLQRGADAVAVGAGSDQQYFQPVVGVSAIVAQE